MVVVLRCTSHPYESRRGGPIHGMARVTLEGGTRLVNYRRLLTIIVRADIPGRPRRSIDGRVCLLIEMRLLVEADVRIWGHGRSWPLLMSTKGFARGSITSESSLSILCGLRVRQHTGREWTVLYELRQVLMLMAFVMPLGGGIT